MERICLHQQIPELGEAEQGGQSRNLMATCVAFRDLSDRHINMVCHLLLQWNLEPIELELSQHHLDKRHRSEPPGDLRVMTNMRRCNSVYTEESTIEVTATPLSPHSAKQPLGRMPKRSQRGTGAPAPQLLCRS